MNRKARTRGRPALDLIEDAVHLLRTAPVATLAVYGLGALPFVLGFLFFWSDMSRSAFAMERLEPLAGVLALLFLWLKLCQNAFARRLWAQVAGVEVERRPWRAGLTAQADQFFWQTTGFILLPVAAVITLPFGWCFAFYQSLTALNGATPDADQSAMKRAWRHAWLWPLQNHALVLIFLGAGFVVFLNVGIALMAVPHLLKTLLGIETAFSQSYLAMLNSTFFATVGAITWLCLDPLVKAVYVLRCFHGESIATGDDLRAELRAIDRRRGAVAAAVLALSLIVLTPAGAAEDAATSGDLGNTASPTARVDAQSGEFSPNADKEASGVLAPPPAELDEAIDDVLQRREFAWRMPREGLPATTSAGESWFQRTIRRVLEWVEGVAKSIGQHLAAFFRWLFDILFGRQGPELSAGKGWGDAVRGLFILLLIVLVAAIGWFVWRLWKNYRNYTREVHAAAVPAVPDLADDSVTASQLPEDEWLKLAREMMARGEFRLALRAFYLAGLAHLAARELVTIARYKSNRDYQLELGRRSHALPAVMAAFTSNVTVFDRVWYGRHEATQQVLAEFEGNLKTIAAV